MARAGDAESGRRPATVVIIIRGLFAAFGRRPFAGRARCRPGGGGRSRCRTLLVLRRRWRRRRGCRMHGDRGRSRWMRRGRGGGGADGKQAAVALPVVAAVPDALWSVPASAPTCCAAVAVVAATASPC